MKKILLAALFALPALAQAQEKFKIKGKVGALNAPEKAMLNYKIGNTAVSDSADIKDGVFKFEGKAPLLTSATITLKYPAAAAGADPKARKTPDALQVYLDKKIKIRSADSIKNAVISRSKVNAENLAYKAQLKPLNAKMAAINADYLAKGPDARKDKAFIQSLDDRAEIVSKEMAEVYSSYWKKHTNTYVGLVAFRSAIGYDINDEVVQPQFDQFSAKIKKTELGKTINGLIAASRNTKVGAMAMNFTQNDVNDKPVSLSDFKGKYVLIDFWASWCGPCRAENPNVVATYNQFKDKNFTVLGVSLDQPGKKEAWLKAIADDNLTWTHVSDLQFWSNAVAKQYGINSIPASFLLDPSGKIIARNLRGDDLKKKLEEVVAPQVPKE